MKQTAVLRWTRLDFNGFAGVMNKLGQQSMQFVIPALAIMVFLLVWAETASHINTSLGKLPGPVQVWDQAKQLVIEHNQERAKGNGDADDRSVNDALPGLALRGRCSREHDHNAADKHIHLPLLDPKN